MLSPPGRNQGCWYSPTNVPINNLQVSGANAEQLFHLNDEGDKVSQAFIQQTGIKAFSGPFDNILFVSVSVFFSLLASTPLPPSVPPPPSVFFSVP